MHCQLCSMDNHVNKAAAAQQGHRIYEAQLLDDSHVIILEVWAGWTCATQAMLPYQPGTDWRYVFAAAEHGIIPAPGQANS